MITGRTQFPAVKPLKLVLMLVPR